jgi:hypothetical protein
LRTVKSQRLKGQLLARLGYELYSILGDVRKVAYYEGKYIELKDSVYNGEFTARVLTTGTAFTQRRNEAEVAR